MDNQITKSTDQREKTLEKKYGGKAALAAKRREWQAKSRQTYKGTGGFKYLKEHDPEKFKLISSKGGKGYVKPEKTTDGQDAVKE